MSVLFTVVEGQLFKSIYRVLISSDLERFNNIGPLRQSPKVTLAFSSPFLLTHIHIPYRSIL